MRVSLVRLDLREGAADFEATRSFETASTGPKSLTLECLWTPVLIPPIAGRSRPDRPVAGREVCRILVRNMQNVVTRSSGTRPTSCPESFA